MKRFLMIVCVLAAGVTIGAVAVYFLLRPPANTDRWISAVPNGTGLGFSSKVISVDFSIPDSKKPNGKVKFLNRDKGIQLGYVLTLPIDPKPTKTLPAKYTGLKTIEGGMQVGPPVQFELQGNFDFTLKDKDGFVLSQLKGPEHYLEANSQNQVQGTVDDPIPPSIVKRTKIIEIEFYAADCVPCDAQ
jgi:hypothetical protein